MAREKVSEREGRKQNKHHEWQMVNFIWYHP